MPMLLVLVAVWPERDARSVMMVLTVPERVARVFEIPATVPEREFIVAVLVTV
jgi:hypothetical protein